MKSLIILCLLFGILILSLNCSFQAKIFAQMNKSYKGENFIISPLSIYQALSLASNGAKGSTLKEMISVLDRQNITDLNQVNYDLLDILKDFSSLEIANAVLTKFIPSSSFSDICEKYFAPVNELKSVEQVNQWCSEKTHGKIEKILDKLSDDIIMIVLNAIYFKGEWITKFSKSVTSKKPFYNLGLEENELQVDTMKKEASFNYFENDKIQVVELPYKKDFSSAIIILPSKDININDFIESIDSIDNLYEIIDNFKNSKVNLELPKFELEFSASLKNILQDMGMKKAFTNLADFTGLKEGEIIKIDEVLHKTYLKVNEEGTEAAAITAIMNVYGSAFPKKEIIYEMKVNRPFLFLIRSKNLPKYHDILFISKIEKLK